MNRWYLAVAAVVAAAVVAAALVFNPEQTRHDPGTVGDSPAESGPFMYAADSRGAVVSAPKGIRGVARDGRVAWSVPAAELRPNYVVCAPTCPAAVLSSDGKNYNSPLAPDPAPLLKGGAQLPAALRGATGGKTGIVAISPRSSLRLSSDRDGNAEWTIIGRGAEQILPAGYAFVDWFPTNDGTAALAAIEQQGGLLVERPWALRDGVWEPVGDGERWRGDFGFGCVSSRARYWVNDGASIKSADGGAVRFDVQGQISNCSFTSDGLVVTSHTMSSSGSQTRMTLLGLDGTVRATTVFERETIMATDVNAEDFVMVGGREAWVFDGEGRVQQKIRGVSSALFDENGDLVTVSPEGEVRWRPM